jgi:hypothetical protein
MAGHALFEPEVARRGYEEAMQRAQEVRPDLHCVSIAYELAWDP